MRAARSAMPVAERSSVGKIAGAAIAGEVVVLRAVVERVVVLFQQFANQ